jgi:crotonobetainyl-CoA:carnitine CoA-transferase CaiB-like acyl-CoA transferase
VLDLTRLLPGAAATSTLAQFGAEVIKVEEPGRGDYARSMPPLVEGRAALFDLLNRGKKSIALDLKDPRGRDALLKLAESAGVLIEGFRPGVLDRLGVGWEALRARNPRIVYVALTGYGAAGTRAQEAGHDVNYIALGGLLDQMQSIPGVQIADIAGGAMQAVTGILLALAAREKTGRGQRVDVAMLDGVVL